MTDFGKVKSLLDELGIEYDVCDDHFDWANTLFIVLNVDKHDKVDGYVGFYTFYAFNKDDEKFKQIGVYE